MKLFSVLCALIVAYAAPVFAEETVKLSGPFEINPAKGHKKVEVAGEMKLYFEDEKFTKVEAILTKPTFGKSDLFSKEAYFMLPAENQIALATMFTGTPHKFFLVWVGTLQEDKVTYAGDWYRVNQEAEAIQETLKTEFKEAPEDWIKVGLGSFTPPTI